MTQKHQSSPYDDLNALHALRPHRYSRDFADLDALGQRVKAYDKAYKHAKTKEDRYAAKTEMLSLLHDFDRATPKLLQSLELQGAAGATSPHGEGEIGAMVGTLTDIQTRANLAVDVTERASLKAESAQKVGDIIGGIAARRVLLQPRRPRVNTDRIDVLEDISFKLYSPYAHALAASAAADRATPEGRRTLERLPHINQVAKETQAFVAMLDFAKAVEEVIKQCHGKPESYWQEHQAVLQERLTRANQTFNDTIRPLGLTVTAADEGLKTSRAYEACIEAERHVLNARSLGEVRFAFGRLKHHAFEFVVGGADKSADEVHHKLFTRIKEAYRADVLDVRTQEADYERTHDIDRHPFENPLTSRSLHVMNRVYEARWALAADTMVDLLTAKRKTVADPAVAHPSTHAPSNHVAQVRAKSRVQSEAMREEKKEPKPLIELSSGVVYYGREAKPQGRGKE